MCDGGTERHDNFNYNNEVRVRAHLATVDLAHRQGREDPCNLFIFTDGSARKVSRNLSYAGWGCTVVENHQNGERTPIVSACGPVQTKEDVEFSVGATRSTNNTAEMQALIEALYWLNSGIEDKSIPDYKIVMVTVDSLYVKGLIEQKFTSRENKAIALLLCHLWKVVSSKVNIKIRRVHGHTGDARNTIADELADLGTRLDGKHRWL